MTPAPVIREQVMTPYVKQWTHTQHKHVTVRVLNTHVTKHNTASLIPTTPGLTYPNVYLVCVRPNCTLPRLSESIVPFNTYLMVAGLRTQEYRCARKVSAVTSDRM